MAKGLSDNENKEALDVVKGLDSVNFVLSRFDQWLRANAFEPHDIRGGIITFKGSYGYVQFEYAYDLGGEDKVVNCWYIAFTNIGGERKVVSHWYISSANISEIYPLVKEGISISGKSFSKKDLKLLMQYRYEAVEHTVKFIIEDQIGQRPELHMKLRDDLELDEELDLFEIIGQLEDEFDCTIYDEDVKSFETVEDVISFIRKAKGISA